MTLSVPTLPVTVPINICKSAAGLALNGSVTAAVTNSAVGSNVTDIDSGAAVLVNSSRLSDDVDNSTVVLSGRADAPALNTAVNPLPQSVLHTASVTEMGASTVCVYHDASLCSLTLLPWLVCCVLRTLQCHKAVLLRAL